MMSCTALYKDCLRSAAYALARVTNMPAYDDCVADAVSALRVFVEKCQSPFDAQEITSQLEQVNRESGARRISWALLEVFCINFYPSQQPHEGVWTCSARLNK